jgi:surface polysaccharide O-acyltransferase-like enzyme
MAGNAVAAEEEIRPEERTSPQARLSSLDVCRGIAILAVLFIHVSGHFLPALHPPKSPVPPTWAWYALAIPNQDFQWAVPCFLMLSAFVNALSLARGNDVGRYARRRVQAALLPYVIWSGVYIIVDTLMAHRPFPGPIHIAKLLLTGTAHFHLYFFVLVLEMYILLPLLLPLFRKRLPFWAVTLGAVVLQGAIYVLNRYVLLHRFQTTILWDVFPVALGLWLWSQSARWAEVFRKGVWGAGAVTLTALAVYTPLALTAMLPHPHINTAVYQFGEWVYTAGMSFLTLALAGALGRNRFSAILSYLGAESLAIYVMHPLAIGALDKLGVRSLGAGAGMVVYYAACLALPLIAVWAWKQGKTAFGRGQSPA